MAVVTGKEAIRDVTVARGFNARWADEEGLSALLAALTEGLATAERAAMAEVYFYSAGIDDTAPPNFIFRQLQRLFPQARIIAASDLMLVAHALFAGQSGIVGILGTGSVAARYEGGRLHDWMRSLGYLYGDEGSGSHIARRLLQYYISRQMPAGAREQVAAFLGIPLDDYGALLEQLYPPPGQRLSGLVRAMGPFFQEEWWQAIVRECFEEYLRFKVLPLYSRKPQPIGISGGIAATFSTVLKTTFAASGLPTPAIIRAPLPLITKRI